MGWIGLIHQAVAQQGSLNQSNVFIDTAKGNQSWRIRNFNINGNNVESIITNWGTVGNGNATINQAGVWPKGTGHGTIHEMTGLVASFVYDKSGQRLAIVSDGYGGSREDLAEEQDPLTNIRYKFQPIPGYFNPAIANPELANSRNESSWPLEWPDRDASWNGAWNGYFGLNQFNADQEVFYVMDDLSNKEYRYFPIGGDTTKGGLGVQIRVRLFQWSQALAKDIIFMQYEVSNIGDSTYTNNLQNNPIIFGGYTDINAAGSGATDDDAFFNVDEDIVYGWSFTGIGRWTQFRDIPPGYVGWKFLESPGIDTDLIDNDNDGLMDESRDNGAGNLVFGPIGNYGDPKEHWSGDEDGDWNPLLDDVGSDGIGPDGDGYPGPDADGTEGNGRPDQGEPNFGRLDNDESDQVGLTSFQVEDPSRQSIHDENALWPLLAPNSFDVAFRNNNQAWIFGSGPFNLVPNRSQRFSTAFVWGVNEDAMFRSAQVAQRIYDSDYRFARPPRQPELQAIPGDGKVTLVWDNLAEFSNDPIYGRDFEGYRILKSTDPQFNDAVDITDGFGNPVYKRGIVQYDKINGLEGYHPLQFGEEIDLPNGVHYWMGTDNGLQHSYVDTDVINGRTYYYAIIAYDAGYVAEFFDEGISEFEFLFPISPSESPASITVEQGVITNFDRNTASARPNPPPSDYEVGTLSVDAQNRVPVVAGTATGTVKARLVDDRLLRNATFTITFEQTPFNADAVEYVTSSFSVTDNDGLVIVDREPIPTDLDGNVQNTWTFEVLEEGFVLEFENQNPDLTFTQQSSAWTENSVTNLLPSIDLTPTFTFPIPPEMPINVTIEVVGDGLGDSLYTSTTGSLTTRVLSNLLIRDSDTGEKVKAIFVEKDSTRNGKIDIDETIQFAFQRRPTSAALAGSWRITFRNPVDASNVNLPFSEVVKPQVGDRYELRTMIPFGEKDTLSFVATEPGQLANAPKSILDEIVVVPNPYIAATITEGRPFLSGRGERRIEFRNLPTQARLKIFSASGVFIKELEVVDGLGVFNLQNKDGQEVAFGLYFYHVEAPGIGEKVGKFAIIN
jgi:hypothetical protein